MDFIDLAKNIYRTVVPQSIRHSNYITRLKPHDLIYDAEYYDHTIEATAMPSATTMAATISDYFEPRSVIDVGCGTGALLAALREHGCETFGLEYSKVALQYCQQRQLDVQKFDIENDAFHVDRTFAVAVSMEVAEHLPAAVASRYVDLLTSVAPIVVFTAAVPGQGGTDHVNEQPHSYWIEKFKRRGYVYLADLSAQWRAEWEAAGDVQSWYFQNLMLFRQTAV